MTIPWNLVRRLLHRSTLVLTSHQRLDELLTTGYNEVLLRRLGVEGTMQGIVGYKGDPERKIGLVGRLPVRVPPLEGDDEGRREYGEGGEVGRATFEDWLDAIRHEFPDVETPSPPSLTEEAKDSLLPTTTTTTMPINPEPVPNPPPQSQPPPLYIACMNAFDPETIDRAIAAASALSLSHCDTAITTSSNTTTTDTTAAAAAAATPAATNPPFHPSQIIYLTGQPRPLGLAHAHRTGICPVFAGHRGAEAWAVRYVADCLRCQEWGGVGKGEGDGEGGGVEVLIVDEPEEVVPRQGKAQTRAR
ncbi:hypothetical protein QFC24_001088 [Naganishia onofrii]|uniref:Uncharacterized protein n=1 Tax=Naganishia onofrii TaxID=1851511 RepID=A0ACC2XUX7_9TREE|nr:hypothetical protein QFC24_001088 [Naganishia onofrii]